MRAMSLMTSKQRQRGELERLCDQYRDNGGTISRSPGISATLLCQGCGHRRHVSIRYIETFSTACNKCGAPARVAY
jgi:hypothetical protein